MIQPPVEVLKESCATLKRVLAPFSLRLYFMAVKKRNFATGQASPERRQYENRL
jgi:hypothetical protein